MSRILPRAVAAAAVAALSVAAAPAAHAAPPVPAGPLVCNQASPHWLGGGLDALDPPVDSPAARYTTDIGPLPGVGAGLVRAAAHSPSLTICGPGFPWGGGGGGAT